MGPNSALVLHGGTLLTRAHDTEFRFRPDSNFHYLTGLAEPDSVLVYRPGHEVETTLFVRPRDPQAEVWSGRRVGPEGVMERFGADAGQPLDTLDGELVKLLDGVDRVYLPFCSDTPRRQDPMDAVTRVVARLGRRNRWGETPPPTLCDANLLIGEDRMFKDPSALASLRKAIDLTAAAHTQAMRRCRPGMHEYQIEALIEYEYRRSGSTGPGYASIVGAGDNATILHYIDNTDPLEDGTLLLIDSGCEWDLFSGDITRTWPVNGSFTPAQRDVYQVVLEANEAGLAQSVVGNNIDAIHHTCLRVLLQGLVDLGVLVGSIDELLETEAFKPFYMHRTSHWLGVDVHDAGRYTIERKPRPLEPGMVFTVEPGLYFSNANETVPEALRGMGVRIEDDVLVREQGPEVLSAAAPKTIESLEAIIGSDA